MAVLVAVQDSGVVEEAVAGILEALAAEKLKVGCTLSHGLSHALSEQEHPCLNMFVQHAHDQLQERQQQQDCHLVRTGRNPQSRLPLLAHSSPRPVLTACCRRCAAAWWRTCR
jgi:hypothetical protein